jgi:hypothetical protein
LRHSVTHAIINRYPLSVEIPKITSKLSIISLKGWTIIFLQNTLFGRQQTDFWPGSRKKI